VIDPFDVTDDAEVLSDVTGNDVVGTVLVSTIVVTVGVLDGVIVVLLEL